MFIQLKRIEMKAQTDDTAISATKCKKNLWKHSYKYKFFDTSD